jgi:hypothetical protein
MRNRIILFTTLLLLVIKISAQDTIRYLGLLNNSLRYESIELYDDHTFKLTNEYDLRWSQYGSFQIADDTLILNTFIDFSKPKTMSVADSIKIISLKYDIRRFRKYIIDGDKMYPTNRKGRKIKWIRDPSIGSFLNGHRFNYELIKIK